MTWQAWAFLAMFIALVAALVFGAMGCSRASADLEARQRAIQACILSGGHARLGPDNTIQCVQLNRRVM